MSGSSSNKKVDLKVVLLGDSGVGKTCLLVRFLHGSFGNTTATIGASFATKVVNSGEKTYSLGLWDTAGQERYDSLSSFYCRGAGCAIIAYDITTQSSFKNVQKWVSKLRTSQPDKDCFIILVGTKLDCCKDDKIPRAVETDMAEKMKEQIGAIAFVETSAKTGENVETVFEHIVKNISKFSQNEKDKKDTINIGDGKKDPSGGSSGTGCCG
eukprot:gene7912-12380_t